jgi:hypothetical protein
MLEGTTTTTGFDDNVVMAATTHVGRVDWREVDRSLRRIAKQRGELDVEEARWLVVAQQVWLHRRFGYASFREYMERALGYGPRDASERLRVANTLVYFPQLREGLATGALAYSAIRELARVVTPETEAEWVESAAGKTLRQVEEMVSGRRKGDRPTDPPSDDLRPRMLNHRVSPETYALFRQARSALAEATGHALDDDAVIAALSRAYLDPGGADDGPGRARYQISVTTCSGCERAWQTGAGEPVEIGPAARAVAECDAVRIGRVDAATPEPMTKDIPDPVRRLIWARDHGRCRVPGCRASRNIDVHHVKHRADGGEHTPENLLLLCSGHHRAHHNGLLSIVGTATDAEFVFLRDPAPLPAAPVAKSSPHTGAVRKALVGLGFKDIEARAAVARALTHVGQGASFDDLLKAALQSSRKPRPGAVSG